MSIKKRWLFSLILFTLTIPLFGQVTQPGVRPVATAPSGPCALAPLGQYVETSGVIYGCVNMGAGYVWTALTGGGGSPGTVTNVTGTQYEIDVTNGTTTPAVSIDPAFQFPGTAKSYHFDNTWYAAGFTGQLFAGIGVDQVAWVSGTTNPFCQAVSYSGSNYVAVVPGSGTTNLTATTTPGTNTAVWWPVTQNYNATILDCAFYSALSYAQTSGTKVTLQLGDTTATGPYKTNLCLTESSNGNQVNIRGNGRGWNGGPTQIQASAGCGYIISAPNQSGSLPYGTKITDLQLDGGGVANCMNFAGNKLMDIEHIGCQNFISSTSDPFIIGGATGSYQNVISDIFVQGTGNPANDASVAATFSGGTWTFTITGGTNYVNPPTQAFVTGFQGGASANPCTTMGSAFTVTYTGTGPYTLTGIVQHGTWAGCTGPFFVNVPDMPPNFHGIEFNNLTDSTFDDIVVAETGMYYGIFYNGVGSSVMNHEHPYGPFGKAQIYDIGGTNVHVGAELDTIVSVGAITGGNGGQDTWIGTTSPLSTSIPGQVAFSDPSNTAFSVINFTCKNTTTSANPFYLVVNGTAPIAHGGNFGNVTVLNALECDTLTAENSFPSTLTVPALVSYAGTTAGSSDAYTLASATIPSLQPGLRFQFLPSFANVGGTPTLNVNSLGAITITKNGQSALTGADLSTTALADVIYDGTYFELLDPQSGKNPSSGGAIGYSGTPSLSTTALYASANGTVTSATAASAGWPAPSAAPITGLYVNVATSTTMTVTLYDVTTSTATGLTCTITSGTTCNDVADSFTPAVGDLLAWRMTDTGTLSANVMIGANWATPPIATGCISGCNYFIGTTAAPGAIFVSAGSTLSTTEVPQLMKFYNPATQVIGHGCFNVATLSSGGHVDIGIYSISGTTGTLRWHTGSQSTTSTGVICESSATNYTMIGSANYYMAWCMDNTTAVLTMLGGSSQFTVAANASAPANTAGVDATDTCTAGVLPSTITTTNIGNTSTHLGFPEFYATN